MTDRQPARMFTTDGLDSAAVANARAAEAVLTTARVVPSFAGALAGAGGARVDGRSVVEAFGPGRVGTSTVQGVLRIERGSSTWEAVLLVRTGTQKLSPSGVKKTATRAAEAGHDAVLTISNEPTAPDVGRGATSVPVVHIPWGALLDHLTQQRLQDPEQALVLSELTRFLAAPELGVLAGGADMGPHWTAVNKTARTSRLSKRDAGVVDVAQRWDQAVSHAATTLSETIGREVERIMAPAERRDADARVAGIVDVLVGSSRLEAQFGIEGTSSRLALVAELAAQRLVTVTLVAPPAGLGTRATLGWLLDSLQDAKADTVVEAWRRHGSEPVAVATVGDLKADMGLLIDDGGRRADSYRVVQIAEMATGRRRATGAGFVDSVDEALLAAWATVLAPMSTRTSRPEPESTRTTSPRTRSTRSKSTRSKSAKRTPASRTRKPSTSGSGTRRGRSAADLAKELRRDK